MRLVYLIISLVALLYVVLRAWFVPFTCDESWTFTNYFNASFVDVVTATPPLANNHILNTLLTKVTGAFSTGEFALRLPNVLAFLLYAFASFKIATQFIKHKALGVLLFLLLMSNHALLEFFALSRGYGLSIGLMMMSLYYLFCFVQDKDIRYAHYSLLMICAGVYASFVLLNLTLFIIGYVLLFTILYLKKDRPVGLRVIYVTKHYLIYIAFLAYLILYPILKMSNAHELYYGGGQGFISDTIGTLLADYYGAFFTTVKNRAGFNSIVVSMIVVCSIITLVYAIPKRKEILRNVLFLPAIVLLAMVAAINIQFHYMDINLPINRTGLYLFSLTILMMAFTMQLLLKHIKVIPIIISTGLVTVAGYCFIREMNLNYIEEWWFDQYTPTVLNDMEQYKQAHNLTNKSKLHVVFPTQCAFNYYIATQHGTSVDTVTSMQEIVTEVDPNGYDFVYADKEADMTGYANFVVVKQYGNAFILYANKKSEE